MKNWISSQISTLITLNNRITEVQLNSYIMNEISKKDINSFIDKNQISELTKGLFESKIKSNIHKGYFFIQIEKFINIADPLVIINNQSEEIEKLESKFLANEEEEDPEILQKNDLKSLLKFTFSNGNEEFYGYEYEKLDLLTDFTINKFQKIILGPEIEIRRGLIYLRNLNFSLL